MAVETGVEHPILVSDRTDARLAFGVLLPDKDSEILSLQLRSSARDEATRLCFAVKLGKLGR